MENDAKETFFSRDYEAPEDALVRINSIIKEQATRRWLRIRSVAPLVGRIALFTKCLFEDILSPDGPMAKRAKIEFEATLALAEPQVVDLTGRAEATPLRVAM